MRRSLIESALVTVAMVILFFAGQPGSSRSGGDNANPHTMENSFRKAYTARTNPQSPRALGPQGKSEDQPHAKQIAPAVSTQARPSSLAHLLHKSPRVS